MQKIAEKSKCSEKSKKIPKILFHRKTQEARRAARGVHPLASNHTARPGAGRAPWSPGQVGPTLEPPYGLYLPYVPKTLGEDSFLRSTPLFRRHRDPKIGISRSSCPGTLSEGGLISGGPSITMIASGMLRE